MDEDNIYLKLADEIRKELDKEIFESVWKMLPDWARQDNSKYAIRAESGINNWILQHPESEYTVISSGERINVYEFSEQMETWFLLRWS